MSERWKTIKEKLPTIALILLILYTISLAVATADEVFDLGIFPTKLERMVGKAIKNLKSPDPKIREQAKKELELYGDFAIPRLIKALKDPEVKDDVLKLLKEITGKNFGDNPKEWWKWYKRHKHEF